MEESYLVVNIEEQDFGCEGRPDGMETMVDVVLQFVAVAAPMVGMERVKAEIL